MFSIDDFEKIHWHDNAIHSLRIVEAEDCAGELVLDIDFIAEWLPPVNNAFNFKIAPSDLTFHEVSDLIISINYAAASAAVGPMTISEITRTVCSYPNGHSSFTWRININWPPKSFISFQASGFTQVPRSEPVFSDAQYLSPSERQ